MNFIDILFVIPVAWGLFKGFTKGLIVEVASVASLLLGIYGAVKFSGFISNILVTKMGVTSPYVNVISFGITFLGIVILVFLIAKLVERFVSAASLSAVNKILGAVIGGAKFYLIIGVVMCIFANFNKQAQLVKPETLQGSMLFPPTQKLISSVYPGINNINPADITKVNLPSPDKK